MKALWKLYTGYVALVFVGAALLALGAAAWLERESLADLERALESRAVLIGEVAAPALARAERDPALQARVVALGASLGTRLTVIARDGTVLADSHEEPAHTDAHGDRPEVVAARLTGRGAATRHSATVGEPMMYVAARLGPAEAPTGFARAALPLAQVEARVARLRAVGLLAALGAGLLALLPGLALARRISQPLGTMTAVARSIAAGDYRAHVPPTLADDEMGSLARAFDSMAVQLRDRMDTITADHNKLAAILGSMVEGVVAIDGDRRIVHMNDVAGRVLRVDPRKTLGRPIDEVCKVAQVTETLTSTLEAPAPSTGEVRLATPGREQVLKLHASPLRDGGGALAGAVVVLHDITELRRLETLRREFVANVSHELKTPLTAICGLIETLIDDDEMEPGTQRRFLEKVQNQSNRLTTLVRDLLTLSRVESEDASLERARIDLRDPLRDSIRHLLAAGEEKGLVIESEIPEDAVPVLGDREALRQVVDNLLDNALKYTPAGGRVWVRLRREGERAVLEVQDTGIGIEPRDQARIFERFYRVDKARSRDLGGTGLGLSIVKHIMLAHDGQVAVESRLGEGSTFRVSFRLAPAEAPHEPHPALGAGALG